MVIIHIDDIYYLRVAYTLLDFKRSDKIGKDKIKFKIYIKQQL